MRVYVPGTTRLLMRLHAEGRFDPPVIGRAVTADLRAEFPGADQEMLEYEALADAARASLRLLAEDLALPARRVVLAVDVPDGAVGSVGGDTSCVEISVPVMRRDVAAFMIDDLGDVRIVRTAAAEVSERADRESIDTMVGALAEVDDLSLQWYANQELDKILG